MLRLERGEYLPRLDEAVRLAGVLKLPLEWLVAGRLSPANDLGGIAYELNHLGVSDLVVSASQVPGAFRYHEEVLVLALCGDRPEPRVVEAIPVVIARRTFRPALVRAFAAVHDRRARTRLAWLSEVTLSLARMDAFPVAVETERHLRGLIERGVKPVEPDSLGHPADGTVPPAWRRWNITYAGTMRDFLRRSIEVVGAAQ